MENPLSKIPIPGLEDDFEIKVLPYSLEQLWSIQQRCMEVDDEFRWVIAALSNTGARLSEVAGLYRDEVFLDEDVPYIQINFSSLRRIKNRGSIRTVPLVGVSLWAVKRAYDASSDSEYLFPTVARNGRYDGKALSTNLNKWLTNQKLRGKSKNFTVSDTP
ncbi:phage integrase [Rhodobacteraceae bacterium KLH11]|nr:phage integrase [Rhodobacteraceae bacterium KLH11]